MIRDARLMRLLGMLALLCLSAAAHAAEPGGLLWMHDGAFQIPGRFDHLDVQTYNDLLEQAAGQAPANARVVTLWAENSAGKIVPADSLLPPAKPPPMKYAPGQRSYPNDVPGAHEGFLSGRAVYLSQCHGWLWYDTLNDYSTQRGLMYDTVEDFHNPEGTNQFLAPYLENAGAGVYTVKERDTNPNMAIADNDGTGYTETGSGFRDGPAGFAAQDTYADGVDPFALGTTREFPADGGGVATWTPNVPTDGWYAVYVTWDSDPTHASDAHYRFTTKGGVIDRTFDQTVHGSTWQYVDTLWLEKGTDSLKVELIGDSSESGKYLDADAVRVGGGMGQVLRGTGIPTGRPRWEEGAQLYTQYNGAPASIYANDVSARSKWAAWEHPAGEDAVYLSWHSNACGSEPCTARGTTVYYYAGPDGSCTNGAAVTGSPALAQDVADDTVGAFRALWDPSWQARGTNGVAEACFGEVNPGYNDEMPAILVELAFHDNPTDVEFLKNPAFRRDAARAMYHGIVKYFADRDGITPHYLPEPPDHLAVVHDASTGKLTVSWQPGPSGDPLGDPADSYLVETSADGHSWDVGTPVDGTSYVLPTPAGQDVYLRVIAVNAGGVSFPSEAIGARRSEDGTAPVLVVSGFDRLDTGLLPWENVPRLGNVRRMYMPRVNPYDTAAVTGRSIAQAGWSFDSVSNEVFDGMDVSSYRAIVWVAGEQSTVDQTFTPAEEDKVRSYIAGGGTLIASGAEILWDLDYKGDATDQAFAHQVLGATYAADSAGTTVVSGQGLLARVGPLDFGEDVGGEYPVEYPDTMTSNNATIAVYDGGAVAGVLGDQVAMFGFPLETIGDPAVRAAVFGRLLSALMPDLAPTGDTGDTADTGGSTGWTRHEIPAPGCKCATGGDASGLAGIPVLLLLVAFRRRRLSSGPRGRRSDGDVAGDPGPRAE